MRRIVVAAFLILGAVGAFAQGFPSQRWHQGEIVLSDNSRRQGEIKYDLDHDVVQARINGRTETYSAKTVTSFSISYVHRAGNNKKRQLLKRNFFSLPFNNESGYKRLRFFEVIVEGKATLLAREYINTITSNVNQRGGRFRRPNAIGGGQPITRTVLAHRLYLADLDGGIQELNGKRKDVLYHLRDHESEMKKFIKIERLKLGQIQDMARLFSHYNAISDQQSRAY